MTTTITEISSSELNEDIKRAADKGPVVTTDDQGNRAYVVLAYSSFRHLVSDEIDDLDRREFEIAWQRKQRGDYGEGTSLADMKKKYGL